MKQEIQNRLKELANLFLDDYSNHRAFEIKDLMNASFVFSSVMLDFAYSKNKDTITQKGMEELAHALGESIRELIMASTDIDPKEHKDEMLK